MPVFYQKHNKVFLDTDDHEIISLDNDSEVNTELEDNVFLENEDEGKNDEGDENDNDEDNTNKSPKIRHKRYWKILKNTVRFNGQINKSNAKKKRFNVVTKSLINTDPHHGIQCLLEKYENGGHSEETEVNQQNNETSITHTEKCIQNGHNENNEQILDYFINLSQLTDECDKFINYDYLKGLFLKGVDVDTIDRYGQSVLHEVARMWHVDVAKFLLYNDANVNHVDDFGRTPLHVACAVDYAEMVEFLLSNGADINCKTFGEEQSVVHYAARNDSVEAFKVLLKYNADINVFDYKGRTPLQVAAEHDREEIAQALINAGADVGSYDEFMRSTIVLLIKNMPSVALQALNQFHQKCKTTRREYFYLNHLTPPTEESFAKSPLEVAVETKQFNILMHPVFQRLIDVKWKKLGRWGAYLYGIANLLLTLLWTIPLCFQPVYKNNGEFDAWIVVAVVTLLVCMVSELREFINSKKKSLQYRKWRENQLNRDIQFVHPRWPEEKMYLEREISSLHEEHTSYLSDMWNYLDWLTYSTMSATIITKCIYMSHSDNIYAEHWMRTFSALALMCLWLRMLKYSRPFRTLGPFIAILNHVVTDTALILYLALHIFIPSVASFWIVFGSHDIKEYSWRNFSAFFNVFLMSVGGPYEIKTIKKESPLTSRLLCFINILLGAVVCMNLFIALMTNTFQRVYDNLSANAIFQRAAAIIELEADLNTSILKKHREWIIENCSPDSLYITEDNEDEEGELKRVTLQLKTKTDQILQKLESKGNESNKPNNASQSQQLIPITDKFAKHSDILELKKTVNNFQEEYQKSVIRTREDISALSDMFQQFMVECKQRDAEIRAKELMTSLNKAISAKQDNDDNKL